jgi:hypothetical protein
MKLVAIIENSIVASIVPVDDADLVAALQSGGVVLPWPQPYGSTVQVGWGYDGNNFIAPIPPPFVPLADPGRDRQRDLTSLAEAITKQDQPAINALNLKLLQGS